MEQRQCSLCHITVIRPAELTPVPHTGGLCYVVMEGKHRSLPPSKEWWWELVLNGYIYKTFFEE